MPVKLIMYRAIQEMGAQSVLGRTLTPHEVYEMRLIIRIADTFQDRLRATNDVAWANNDPYGFELLTWAERIANG